MAFDDNLKKIEEYRGLYFRDSESIFGDKKILGRRDLSKLNKKRGLVFSYIIKVDGKRYRKNFDNKDTIFNTPLEVVKKLSRELDDIKLAIKNGEPVSIRDKKQDILAEVSAKQEIEVLMKALSKLKGEYREIIILRPGQIILSFKQNLFMKCSTTSSASIEPSVCNSQQTSNSLRW